MPVALANAPGNRTQFYVIFGKKDSGQTVPFSLSKSLLQNPFADQIYLFSLFAFTHQKLILEN